MYHTEKIKVVIATRLNEQDFPTKSETAKSLLEFKFPNVHLRVAFDNTNSLSLVYNSVIEETKNDPAILVFMHDDIIMLDYLWPLRIIESLKKYDVIGIAGSKVRHPCQGSWGHKQENGTYIISPNEDLSGIIKHGKDFDSSFFSFFGELDNEVKLLDGVLLAVHSDTLHKTNVRFDPVFDFNLYDLDFCRSAEQSNLRMGTCPLAIIHCGKGQYLSDNWKSNYSKYIEKWKE
jgi:GT2 family glycosyltransferase